MTRYQSFREKNICKEGNSYRVRISKNGKKISRSFSNLQRARNFKKEVLNG